ncbi:MAG: leucine-rich repeat domain-containing protein, partial [Proteobacteria bacterium]
FRKAEATVSENCKITPYNELYTSSVGDTLDRSIPHNCSTWGGNSGGPFVVEGASDVVGLPGSYSPNYHSKNWMTGAGFGFDGRVAELNLIETLIGRYSSELNDLGVQIVAVPSFVPPEVLTTPMTQEESAFSQDCFINRNDRAYVALLSLAATTDCVTAARKLSRVSELMLADQNIFDLNFLRSGLFNRNLKALYVQDNAIQSLEGIQSLLQLKLLDISNYNSGYNSIESIELLESTKVARLFASRTGFKDLTQIRYLPLIIHLEVAGNGIESLTGLRTARSDLQVLDVSFNNLTDLQGIESALSLSELTATANQLTSLDDLSQNKYLTYLSLGSNKINSIEGLKRIPYLRTIDMNSNDISGKVDISEWPNLRSLSLMANKISSINLSSNPLLNWIGLSPDGFGLSPYINVSLNPQLRDLSSLLKFGYIYYLNISDTAVEDLSPLRNIDIYYAVINNIPLDQLDKKTNDNCPKDAVNIDVRNYCLSM